MEATGSEDPALVEFRGEWCAPCHKLSPILAEIAEERADYLKVLSPTPINPRGGSACL